MAEGLARMLFGDEVPVPDPARPDSTISRDEMLTRFRTARDTIRDELERHRSTLLEG